MEIVIMLMIFKFKVYSVLSIAKYYSTPLYLSEVSVKCHSWIADWELALEPNISFHINWLCPILCPISEINYYESLNFVSRFCVLVLTHADWWNLFREIWQTHLLPNGKSVAIVVTYGMSEILSDKRSLLEEWKFKVVILRGDILAKIEQ